MDPIDNDTALDLVMAWYCQATSHHLSQCWPRSIMPCGRCGSTGPQRVNFMMLNCIWRIIKCNNFAFFIPKSMMPYDVSRPEWVKSHCYILQVFFRQTDRPWSAKIRTVQNKRNEHEESDKDHTSALDSRLQNSISLAKVSSQQPCQNRPAKSIPKRNPPCTSGMELMAPSHHLKWTNINLSSVRSHGIHLLALS